MVNIKYRNIIFILIIFVFIKSNSSIQINDIEKELKVIDELSRISQIKSISNEIKEQAHRKGPKCPDQKVSKSMGKSMKINSNLVVKGNITSGNILAEQITINNNVNIAKTLSSNEILTTKVNSQTTIINELRSSTVIII